MTKLDLTDLEAVRAAGDAEGYAALDEDLRDRDLVAASRASSTHA